MAAHLSQQNNLPELAQAALATVLGGTLADVVVATQADGFNWLSLRHRFAFPHKRCKPRCINN
ncbi:MAG: Metal-dependent hydrolases of the beta-lactamase superfamily I [uncultured Caballeronia sp.]|nr:MAG: Metal-dependent hydrolases of the beta-lactamase superfamily I [uncultured Caballeronia sp.]